MSAQYCACMYCTPLKEGNSKACIHWENVSANQHAMQGTCRWMNARHKLVKSNTVVPQFINDWKDQGSTCHNKHLNLWQMTLVYLLLSQ